jgi:Na+/H+ antiporter NhaD/arsenite permease-like protein
MALLSSAVLLVLTSWIYRKDLRQPFRVEGVEPYQGLQPLNRVKPSGIILALVVVGFLVSRWIGVEVPLIALAGAGLVLAFSRNSPRDIFGQVDWVLLLFFAALFVVIGGAVHEGLLDWAIESAPLTNDLAGVGLLHGLSLVISQLISNVPYTVLMAPVLQPLDSDLLWLSLASSATLAGNLTLIGAVANLIVAERATHQGVEVTFWEFFKLGLLVTVVSLIISLLVLWGEKAVGVLA